ncbi:ketosteroid isomerase-related protein [Chthonobacter rhizosphaerae]|uniref:ketosteroid isomerase-related protein n=1 Tax=Chthonobacter rhizosphaerae TaxID=2735553 RepID=UPI0015EEF319|nr:ketosteroid isomerase-related protein [Chthonobacter rhizosphaerae]
MDDAAIRSLIDRYIAAFNEGSIAGMLACVSDDVVLDVNQGGRRVGREKFETYLIHMARCYRERMTDVVLLTAGDGLHAAAEYTVSGTYLETDDNLPPANGQTYSVRAGSFFEVENGRISRMTTYYDLDDWIEQVAR